MKASAGTNETGERLKEFQQQICSQSEIRSVYERISRQKGGRYVLSQKLVELGEQLVSDNKIASHHIAWPSEPVVPFQTNKFNTDPTLIDKLESVFAVHPDLPDQRLNRGLLAKLFNIALMISFSEVQDLQTVNKRKKMEEASIKRLGFLFVGYKVEFWYWELIEMSRK